MTQGMSRDYFYVLTTVVMSVLSTLAAWAEDAVRALNVPP